MLPETQQKLIDLLRINANAQPSSIAAPIEPSFKNNPFFDYLRQDPLVEQVTGGDPLKKLLRFAATMTPGVSTDLARYEGDKLGEALSYLDILGAASLPAKAVVKGADATTDIAKDMMFLHNLRPEALETYVKIGGIPSPSIAVTQKDIPFEGYSPNITLVGKPEKFDPSLPNNPVYSADAYSPRMPEVFYKPAPKALDSLIDDYNELAEITGESNKIANLEFDINKAKKRPTKVFQESLIDFFNNSEAARLKFAIDEKGINPKDINENNFGDFVPDSYKGYYDWSDKQINKLLNKETPYFEKVDPLYEKKSNALYEKLENARKVAKETGDWSKYESLERQFSNLQKYKTVPATAEAIAKNMKADVQRGGEAFYANAADMNPTDTPNLARALLSRQFKNLDEIKEAKGLLSSNIDEFNYSQGLYDIEKAFEPNIVNPSTELNNYFKAYRALGSHEKVLKEYPDLKPASKEFKKIIDEFEIGKRPYFESKPTRVVGFDEFEGAIVNENLPQSTINLLESLGLRIEKFDPFKQRNRGSGDMLENIERTEARNKFQDQMFNMLLPTAAGAYGYNTINNTEE